MKKQWLLLLATAFGSLFTGVNPLSAQIWTPTSAPTKPWSSVACSADGNRLVAAVNYGRIYTSTNSGATWTQTSAPVLSWSSVASSADGSELVAVVNGGGIYTSTSSGATWTQTSAPALLWSSVASSADGSELVAAVNGGGIYTSTNSGATWTLTSAPTNAWSSVACSADGSKLVAAVNGGGIYTSTNSGATWTQTSAANASWSCTASSVDGTKLVAVSAGSPIVGGCPLVYISTNSGTAWYACHVFWAFPMGFSGHWSAVNLSADGTKLVVAAYSFVTVGQDPGFGLIYTSTDSGTTWNSGSWEFWSSVAGSADGSKLVAASDGGWIYISQTTPAPVLNIAPSSNNLAFSWLVPSTNFVLQQNFDLTTTNWVDVTNTPTLNLTNLQNEVTFPLPAGNAFYRLKTP